MSESMAVPTEIQHLDFESATESKEGFSTLKECEARLRGTKNQCLRPANWQGTLRCCMSSFPVCDAHKKLGETRNWYCKKCKKVRAHEWMGWTKL